MVDNSTEFLMKFLHVGRTWNISSCLNKWKIVFSQNQFQFSTYKRTSWVDAWPQKEFCFWQFGTLISTHIDFMFSPQTVVFVQEYRRSVVRAANNSPSPLNFRRAHEGFLSVYAPRFNFILEQHVKTTPTLCGVIRQKDSFNIRFRYKNLSWILVILDAEAAILCRI